MRYTLFLNNAQLYQGDDPQKLEEIRLLAERILALTQGTATVEIYHNTTPHSGCRYVMGKMNNRDMSVAKINVGDNIRMVERF